MAKIVPIVLENGTKIMVESTDGVEIEEIKQKSDADVRSPVFRSPVSRGPVEKTLGTFKNIQETIKDYTDYTLKAFEGVAFANVNKVSLEFGIKIGGEAGIPYITRGTAEGNIKITVECTFPDRNNNGIKNR